MSYPLEAAAAGTLAGQIRAGLAQRGQKELPCSYLYDEVGSALFEVISVLPEYGLTRAGDRLLQKHAAELTRLLEVPVTVAELGSGTGRKTRRLLQELAQRQKTLYCPIEISAAALRQCSHELSSLPGVEVSGYEMDYLDGLSAVSRQRTPGSHLLVLFLGSTIGNFHPVKGMEFLQALRRSLQPADSLLLATDLVKPADRLQLAYDDPLGVTAAFNLNLLSRLNREMGADFAIRRFRHEARWNEAERRIEMHLRSLEDQTVFLPRIDLSVTFLRDETIWTESSYKYTLEDVDAMARQSGFNPAAQWIDTDWGFAQTLCHTC